MLEDAQPALSRWTIDLNDDSVRVEHEYIDDLESEFPQLDQRYAMSEYRYGFFATSGPEGLGASGMYNGVGRYDHQTGKVDYCAFGDKDTTATSEAIFVPRSEDAAEGDGFLLAVATDKSINRSRLVILDAQNVADGPLATAHLNHKVPVGFHGGWKPADA